MIQFNKYGNAQNLQIWGDSCENIRIIESGDVTISIVLIICNIGRSINAMHIRQSKCFDDKFYNMDAYQVSFDSEVIELVKYLKRHKIVKSHRDFNIKGHIVYIKPYLKKYEN